MMIIYFILMAAGIVLFAKEHGRDKDDRNAASVGNAAMGTAALAGVILGLQMARLPGSSSGNKYMQGTFFLIMGVGISLAICNWAGMLIARLRGKGQNGPETANTVQTPVKKGTDNKGLRILQLIGSVYLLIGAGAFLMALPSGIKNVTSKNGNVLLFTVLILAFAAAFAFAGLRGIRSYRNWKAVHQENDGLDGAGIPAAGNTAVKDKVEQALYSELGAKNIYDIRHAEAAGNSAAQRYAQLADQYAHEETLLAENPRKKELEAQLLAGGEEAQKAITEYLLLCGSGRKEYGWWNGAAGLTRMIRKIGGSNAVSCLRRLRDLSTNIWEYHTQVKETAEKEMLEIEKESGGYGADGRIPAEYAHAELLSLQDVLSPEQRLEKFFAMKDSVDGWSDADKAFYYFIGGGAARVLYPDNRSNLAFYAAQVFCDPNPGSVGWQYLREAEGSELPAAPTPESVRQMREKYPLPESMEETRNYAAAAQE